MIAQFNCRDFCHINSLEDKISNTAATIQPNPFWFWEIICFSQLSSKSRNSWAVFKTLMSAKNHENCSGALYLQYEYRVKKLGQFMDHIKSYATSKFRKNEVFVSKMHRYPDPSLSLETIFSLKSPMFKGQ